jgi:multicomponent Na+:H+ antiporter subunit G
MISMVGGAFVVLGGVFCVIGVIGMLRLPDVFARLHAAGVTDTLGAGLVLFGLMICSLDPGVDGALGVDDVLRVAKLVFILFFMWVTGTTAAHALAKAAWLDGLDPWTASSDEDAGGVPSKD